MGKCPHVRLKGDWPATLTHNAPAFQEAPMPIEEEWLVPSKQTNHKQQPKHEDVLP